MYICAVLLFVAAAEICRDAEMFGKIEGRSHIPAASIYAISRAIEISSVQIIGIRQKPLL
jgi:hypothetical protein